MKQETRATTRAEKLAETAIKQITIQKLHTEKKNADMEINNYAKGCA